MIVATVAEAGIDAVGGAADTRWVWAASSSPASSSNSFPLGVRTLTERRGDGPGDPVGDQQVVVDMGTVVAATNVQGRGLCRHGQRSGLRRHRRAGGGAGGGLPRAGAVQVGCCGRRDDDGEQHAPQDQDRSAEIAGG
jgi:hypothetical protein